MAEILSELAPLLRENLAQHIAVLIAMVAAGVSVFAAAHRMLPSDGNETGTNRRRIRDAALIGLIIFVFLVLTAMGYLLFNLLTGRYSSDADAATNDARLATEYRPSPQPTDRLRR